MTHEEQRLLTIFLDELGKVRDVAKDPAAEALIKAAGTAQPDAMYLLVQRCLLQDQALNAARSRIEDLQQQLEREKSQPPGAAGGFLGDNPWGRPAAPAPASGPGPLVQSGPLVPPGLAAASPFSGFLGNAVATAAGVAGGAFLFHGIENLLHSSHHDPGLTDSLTSSGHPAGDLAS
ncbi:MAG: DUF2076 domain-containing protein, partial [Methylococcaceae bacterium]|nr:DUF2076 domain-containing protein [Methylococcaceae bacterium]